MLTYHFTYIEVIYYLFALLSFVIFIVALGLSPSCVVAADPFAEAKNSAGRGAKEYVHIRIQQRNGKKTLTTVEGLNKEFNYERILKDLKKEFCCNGTVVQDKLLGKIIQLQGDQRKKVADFLVKFGVAHRDHIKIHGF